MDIVRSKIVLAILVVIVAAPLARARTPAGTSSTIRAGIADLDAILQPLRQRSLRDGRDGRIYPFDLPASPDTWRLPAKDPDPVLARLVRTVLHAAVCFADPVALRTIDDIDWRLYGLGFDQIEALFLQRRAARLNLQLPFHDRYVRARRYPAGASEAPQRALRLAIAFEQSSIDDALELVPAFQRLCR